MSGSPDERSDIRVPLIRNVLPRCRAAHPGYASCPSRVFRRSRNGASTGKQTSDRNILVDVFPMQADTAQFDLFPLGRRRMQQPGKPSERYAKRPPVGQFNPHRVLVKADAGCRNAHKPDYSPWGEQRNPDRGGQWRSVKLSAASP